MRIPGAFIVLCIAAPALVRAGEFEIQAVNAAAAFSVSLERLPTLKLETQGPVIEPEGWMGDKVRQALKDNIFPLSPQGEIAVPSSPAAAELKLDDLLDRHWKTEISFPLGGRPTFIGGSFSRARNGYLSVLAAGAAAPKFYSLPDLVDAADRYTAGEASYSVAVRINIFNPRASQLVFENEDDRSDSRSTDVTKLFDAAYASGMAVKLSNQSYQAFYAHEIKDGAEGPALDLERKTLGLMIRVGDDLKAFLVPSEVLIQGRAEVFTLKDGKKVALALSGSTLRVFEL